MANDLLQPGGTRQVALVQGPAHGNLTLNADGSFDYTPATNYNGPDSFKYTLVEGGFSSNTVTVFLTVQPVNDPPTAADDAYGYRFHSPFTVSAADGVLKNDADIDGNTLHAILVDPPAEGSVDLHDDGSFVFTHPEGMTGTVTFTYKVNDGTVDGPTVTVTLSRAANAPPTAVNDAYSLAFASPLVIAAGRRCIEERLGRRRRSVHRHARHSARDRQSHFSVERVIHLRLPARIGWFGHVYLQALRRPGRKRPRDGDADPCRTDQCG